MPVGEVDDPARDHDLADVIRPRRVLPDLLVLLLLLGLGLQMWPRPEPGTWLMPADRLLDGPDAAAWAANAVSLARWDLAGIDLHRAPTYVIAVAATIKLGLGVAEGGHLINHGAQLLLPLVLYGLGRVRGSAGAGLLAAGLAMYCWPLVQSSRFYGADPLIAFLLAASMLLAMGTARWWGLSAIAGAVGAMLAAAHYTTPPQIIPVLLMILVCGRGWRAPAATLLAAGIATLVIVQVLAVYPVPDLNRMLLMIQEGVAKDSSQSGVADPNWRATLSVMGPEAQHAFARALTALMERIRPAFVPYPAAVACLWLGVAGFGLGTPTREGWRGFLQRFDTLPGLVLLSTLAPLPVYAAAHAPERYGWMLLPTGMLLVGRGVGSVFATADLGLEWLRAQLFRWTALHRLLPRWPSGALGILAAGIWVYQRFPDESAALKLRPVTPEAIATRKVGDALGEHFPPGVGASTPLREAAVYASLTYCPLTVCPNYAAEDDYRRCLVIVRKECAGDADFAWVAMGPSTFDQRSAPRRAMDAWMIEHFPVAERVTSGSFYADVVRVPREPVEGGW